MELRNHTPFVPFLFEGRDPQDRPVGVFVLKGTFALVPGAPLRPVPEQRPIFEADQYHGDPVTSSVCVESDVCPFKPRTGLIFNAVARAPHGQAAPEWLVRVRAGQVAHPSGDGVPAASADSWKLEAFLRVTGPRRWRSGPLGWQPGEPAPCTEVPIRYEHAYGGAQDVGGGRLVYEPNPIGTGYFLPKLGKPPAPVAMPQVESPFDPVLKPGHAYAPVGLGPVGRAWPPRRALGGTYDARWQRERAPRPPHDFDYAYFNGAPAALQWDGFMRGDETIALLGLHSAGEVTTRLPDYRVGVLVRRVSGRMDLVPLLLDTVYFDLEAPQIEDQRITLVWRGSYDLDDRPRAVEARLRQGSGPSAPEVEPTLADEQPAGGAHGTG